ncbi:MAG: efflux RND transporter periplasmic adaptor subunit [Nevskia sp.]|nr:efflux RND transporter periplasmic adaptor subunit [Nevskia sp.]
MNDQSALLKQLRIEREEPPEGRGGGSRKWWFAGATVLALAALAIGWLAWPRAIPVHVAIAQALPDAGQGGASLLDASGYVVARRQATVSAQIIGTLSAIDVEEGEHVKQGQVLARLEDTQYKAQLDVARGQAAAAQAQVAQARAQLQQAEADARRYAALVADHLVSAQQAEQARTQAETARATLEAAIKQAAADAAQVEAAQVNYDYTVVRAPFDGVITNKAAQVGEIVSPYSAGNGFTRTGIATIVDMDSLEVEVDVNENFINRVRADQPATIRLNAYPDWAIPGQVIAIIPSADRSKATVKVRVGFLQKDPRILPEMGARVSFLSAAQPGASAATAGVTLPPEAVQAAGETGVVWLIRDAHVERRAVRLGARTSAGQVILSGLAPGERVALGDLSKLQDGARIAIEP